MKNNCSTRKILTLAVLPMILIFAFTTGCSKTSSPGPNEVFIEGMAYTPSTITVTAGTTVTWTNKDGVAHTVTSAGNFDSGSIGSNGTWSHQFTTAGTFQYVCTFHASMNGTVKVN
jgi:plastocyanin